MIKIKPVPVGYPAKQANGIDITMMSFSTNATSCSTYYQLYEVIEKINEEGNIRTIQKVLADGNSSLTEEQYSAWGDDNSYVEDIILTNLGLKREIIE